MNIKTKSQSGFTIVELLIVVVVIAILAAITLVSFNNITNRANDSAAKETASNVQKKIELYNAEKSAYPTTQAQLTAADESFSISPATMIGAADPTESTGKNYVRVNSCTGGGAQVVYWQYNKSGANTAANKLTTINIGTTTTCIAMVAS